MFGYIYLVRNKINDKKYIGQKKSPVFVEDYLGSGVYLKRAVNEYGRENFEHVKILQECNSKEELDEAERYWIDHYDAVNSSEFYNLARGGIGTVAGSRHSDTWKENMSKTMTGKTHSEYTKNKIRNNVLGRVWINNSLTEKQVLSKDVDSFLSEGYTLGRLKFSEEHIRKTANARRGHCYESEESLKRRSELMKGEGNPFYGKTHTEEKKAYWRQIRKNKVWVNKDGVNTTINSEQLDQYISEGWTRGIVKKKRGSTTIESITTEKSCSE